MSMLNCKVSKVTFGNVENVRECVDNYILKQFKGRRSDTIKVVTVWYTEFKIYTREGKHIRTDVSIYAFQSRQLSEFIAYPFVEYKDNGNMYIRQTMHKRTLA